MADNETIAEIIAEMRFHGQQNIDAEKDKPEYGFLTVEGRIALNYADRLEAAHKREVRETVTDCNQFSDAAKLREALRSCLDTICRIVWIDDPVYDEDGHYLGANYAAVSRDKARAALAAPPRNCDRFATVDEARKAHEAICEKYGKCHHGCPLNNEDHYSAFDCFEAWLFDPATEQEGGDK